jgi:hypothetical protein
MLSLILVKIALLDVVGEGRSGILIATMRI